MKRDLHLEAQKNAVLHKFKNKQVTYVQAIQELTALEYPLEYAMHLLAQS